MAKLNNLVFFLRKRIFRYNTWGLYKEILNNQKLSDDELSAINWEKRKKIVTHAYNNTIFYRKKYDNAGFHPNDLVHPDIFEKIPVLTKDEVRNNSSGMLEAGIDTKHIMKSVTGGSTGNPLLVYHDLRFPNEILGWRMLNWWGLCPMEMTATVYRIISSLNNNSFFKRLRQWPARCIYLDASNMSSKSISCFIDEFVKLKPTVLMGYVGAVEHLAAYIVDNSIEVPSPRLVWVTSAPVSASQRLLFKQAFGAPVLDQYGCCEIYWLAAQCPTSHGLHFFYDARHIEFLDDKKNIVPMGTYGEVALTDLENYAFPLIRYLNGDRGRWIGQSCTCGSSLPLIDSVKGRITDSVILPDGSCLSGDYFTTIFDAFPQAVRQFQICQHLDKSITLKIVPNEAYLQSSEEIELVLKKIKNIVDGQVDINLMRVNSISHDRGKTRYVINEGVKRERTYEG